MVEGHRAEPGGDRPGPVRGLRLGFGAQQRPQAGPVEQVAPARPHVTDRDPGAAQHAEPDVGPTVADGERPGVARQQVLLEQHVQLLGRSRTDPAEVLAEGVPVAPVARAGQAGQAPQRRPDAVRADDVARPHGRGSLAAEGERDASAVLVHAGERGALAHLGPFGPGPLDQRGCRGRGGAPPPHSCRTPGGPGGTAAPGAPTVSGARPGRPRSSWRPPPVAGRAPPGGAAPGR